MGINLIGSSDHLLRSVAEFVDDVDSRYDMHTVQVQIDNGSWRVDIHSTDDDMEDIHHQVWLDQHGGVVDPLKRLKEN